MKIYLAIPYTGHEEESFMVANIMAAQIIQAGHIVISPISHSHPIAKYGLPGTFDFWQKLDESLIDWADEVWVIKYGDINSSKGVQHEMKYAKEVGKPVKILFDTNIEMNEVTESQAEFKVVSDEVRLVP